VKKLSVIRLTVIRIIHPALWRFWFQNYGKKIQILQKFPRELAGSSLIKFCLFGHNFGTRYARKSIKPSKAVVPKLFRVVTQIEVAIRSYYPQYCAVITHNIEQSCGFGSAFPPEESDITPGG